MFDRNNLGPLCPPSRSAKFWQTGVDVAYCAPFRTALKADESNNEKETCAYSAKYPSLKVDQRDSSFFIPQVLRFFNHAVNPEKRPFGEFFRPISFFLAANQALQSSLSWSF